MSAPDAAADHSTRPAASLPSLLLLWLGSRVAVALTATVGALALRRLRGGHPFGGGRR